MALAIDASTPAVKGNNGGSPTSNSVVSPPANSLFLLFFANPIDSTVHISSIAGGTDLSWASLAGAGGSNTYSEVWWAYGSPATFTATCTMSGALTTLSGGYLVAVIVFTGAASTQNGHTKTATGSPTAPSATLTAAAADSWVIGVIANGGNNTAPTIPAGQTDVFNGLTLLVNDTVDVFTAYVQGNDAAGNSNLKINDTAPTNATWSAAVVEVLAASTASADAGQPFAREYPSSHFGPF